MSVTGDPDRPGYRLGVAITDMVAGLYCAQGITAALLARERSGQGQRVDIGMLDTTAALLTYQAANWFATSKIPPRQGNRHATIAPYETFTTQDGEIVIAVGNDETWKKFCPAIGLPELAADPRFTTNKDRMENYDAMRPPIDRAFRTTTSAEWIAILNAAGVANGEVRDIGQMLNDPQLAAREMVADADASHRRRHAGDRRADQVVGERGERAHAAAGTRDSIPTRCSREIGYDADAIAALRSKKVI